MSKISITEEELLILHNVLESAHSKYLKVFDVTMPQLKTGTKYSKNAVVLAILYKYFRKPINKSELTEALSEFLGEKINDVQQARHLGRQNGWCIYSGTRGDDLPEDIPHLSPSDYCLASINEPYPTRKLKASHHRVISADLNFDEIKEAFEYRCATCGSKEGELNLRNTSRRTKLQAGHQDPNKELKSSNIVPQCDECNRAYRDWFIFDGSGRVIDINIASPRWQKKYQLKTK